MNNQSLKLRSVVSVFCGLLWVALLLVGVAPIVANADEQVVIRGTVVTPHTVCPAIWPGDCEEEPSRPLAGIRVEVLDQSNRIVRAARTNSLGGFGMRVRRGLVYRLRVREINYRSTFRRFNRDKNFGEIQGNPLR